MIDKSLTFICSELNAYFKASFQLTEDKVIVSNLINPDGSVPIAISDKLVISLVNIEQENSIASLGFTGEKGKSYTARNSLLNINLYVLFAAYFQNYNEGLKFISATIEFFQSNYLFLKADYPNMDGNTDKLVFELLKTDYQSINYIWGSIGASYMPSMVYKIRMLTVNESNIRSHGTLLAKPELSVADDKQKPA
jgi:Pvc16 N-terminal domain